MSTEMNLRNVLPHRYPFLLIDKILEKKIGKSAKCQKNISDNEPFFQGHFPNYPVMPGVLQVEALAQCVCVAFLNKADENKFGMLTGVSNMKFKKQVLPGDVLVLEAEITAFKMGMGKAIVKATVDGNITAEGIIKFAIVDTKD